jgi:protein-S-isoprenylcysteine O-methyltransferase
MEGMLRKDNESRSLKKTEYDKGSTIVLGILLSLSGVLIVLAPLINHFQTGTVASPFRFGVIGLCFMLVGFYLRVLAAITLGRFYTRSLREVRDHQIISNGIYAIIRNPGYLGDILLFIGASITIGNWILILIVSLFVICSYLYRIRVEESMLYKIF